MDVIKLTKMLLKSLPADIPRPDVDYEVDQDGHADIEWHVKRWYTISVSVSAERYLHYAALIGEKQARVHGSELFTDHIPKNILDIVRRIYAEAPTETSS